MEAQLASAVAANLKSGQARKAQASAEAAVRQNAASKVGL
jgi:hypothetical protein